MKNHSHICSTVAKTVGRMEEIWKRKRNISVVVFIASVERYLYGDLFRVSTSGILPEMSEGSHVSYSSIGLLVIVYAIASAVGTIPLITLTMAMNTKKLLTILMYIFGFQI